MKVAAHGNTDIGRMRRRNEDAFHVDVENRLFAVADGLGGLAAGNRASLMAIEMVKNAFAQSQRDGRETDFRTAFQQAHKEVRRLGMEVDPALGAGTTLTVATVQDDRLHIAHVGDSALYLCHNGDWKKLTIDHTEAEVFRRTRPGEPVPSIYEHTLTRCLGQPGTLEVDLLSHPLFPGCRFLLCTDGVTRGIAPQEISARIEAAAEPRKFVEELLDLANDRGGSDNATAVAVFID